MGTTVKIPDGYAVFQATDGTWKWENILAPECHSAEGFSAYNDAVTHCRMSNDMGYEDWK